MKWNIEISDHYFCCSTLSLLNGDILLIVRENSHMIQGRELKTILQLILDFIERELTSSIYKKFRARKIRKEYIRMRRLYKFRLSRLEDFS